MRSKSITAGVAVACLALLGSAVFSGSVVAKKGKSKKAKVAKVTNATPRPVPDAVPGPADPTVPPPAVVPLYNIAGKLATPLNIGSKKYKGLTAAQVKVTIQTTGAGPNSANQLFFRVVAPNGRRVGFGGGLSGQSIGPLTYSPNSAVGTCTAPVGGGGGFNDCGSDPDDTLGPPYVGTAGDIGLEWLNGAPVRGTWTVSVLDGTPFDPTIPGTVPETSTLNSVSIEVTPAPRAPTS